MPAVIKADIARDAVLTPGGDPADDLERIYCGYGKICAGKRDCENICGL